LGKIGTLSSIKEGKRVEDLPEGRGRPGIVLILGGKGRGGGFLTQEKRKRRDLKGVPLLGRGASTDRTGKLLLREEGVSIHFVEGGQTVLYEKFALGPDLRRGEKLIH